METQPLQSALPGIPLRLVRSRRKTLALEVHAGEEVLVRAPLRLPLTTIHTFVYNKREWIALHWHKAPKSKPLEYTVEEEAALRTRAKRELPPLLFDYCARLGVSPRSITITGARTRFGSCSSKGGIAFSFRLMAYPREAIEYVVLHEAAHLLQLNHSKAFYQLLARHMPDYRARAALLKQRPQG